jgi:hypothetical protein
MEDFMVTLDGLELVSRESRIEIVLLKKSRGTTTLYIYLHFYTTPSPASVTRASRNSPTPNMHPRLSVCGTSFHLLLA